MFNLTVMDIILAFSLANILSWLLFFLSVHIVMLKSRRWVQTLTDAVLAVDKILLKELQALRKENQDLSERIIREVRASRRME